jgi:hypothetical protein
MCGLFSLQTLRGADANIKMDSKEITIVRIQVHHYTNWWWAVVNVVVDVPVGGLL